MPAPRSSLTRKEDTLAKLAATGADVWVATAGLEGAHLVPLSLAWVDGCVVIALEAASVTARNIVASRRARLGLGPTRDVVMIDATLDHALGVDAAPGDLAERYAVQAGWDPRASGPAYAYLLLRPVRVQAWREANEIAGRTLMRDGEWLV